MNKIIIALVFLLPISVVVAQTDYHKGLVAYNRADYATAEKWWSLAGEQGDSKAQIRLAHMYDEGKDGVAQDYQAAAKMYMLLAEEGDPLYQGVLGSRYWGGTGL